MFHRLGRYPMSVRVFPNPILFLAGPKSSWEHGQQHPVILVGGKEMAFRNFNYTEDDDDLAFLPKEPSPDFSIGSPSVSVNTEPLKANKEPDIHPVEVTVDSGESPKPELFIVSDDDDGLPDVLELKDSIAFHLKISAITLPAWKNHLDNHMDLELLDLHNRWRGLGRKSVRGYGLSSKVTSLEAEKARLEAIEVALRKVVKELKHDRREVVSKVIPYAVMELIHSDDMGSLVGKLVSSAIVYGRCRAFEQVADMKKPFDLSKVKVYRSSYKKDHTQASNDLAIATFPWLDKFMADPSALIEALLPKATPSSVPVFNLMSPPADASIVKPQSSQPYCRQTSCANPKGRFPWRTESLIMFEELEDF
ncbi:hypothetical protein Tco_1028263 [Tanacetum coccineum]|uniref:Uncharacterized protein n=1 Tax=Tanacetum coccineum TaxID=301880 RepID=A0ABQ5G2A8_9ASTR